MNAFQKPIGGQFTADPSRFGFAVERGAHRGKLQADTDVVEEAGRLLRVSAACGFAGNQILEIWCAKPKGMLDLDLMRMRRTFFYNIDRIVSRNALLTVAGNIV